MKMKTEFSESDMKAFEPSEKIGIVATIDYDGLPHMSLLTSIMASRPDQLVIGEFSQGLSKEYMEKNKNISFAIVTLDKKLWLGRAVWTHFTKEGPEYEKYNMQPMFRYNTYFGINTVHYLDLLEATEASELPMGSIVASSLLTILGKGGAGKKGDERVLTHFGKTIFNKLDSLKFLSYVCDDGFPVIVPVIQCQAAGDARLAFHPGAFGNELRSLEAGETVAVFCLTMGMEDVLVRGIYNGLSRFRGVTLGTVDIDWVYNSMPPNHGQIYPAVELKPVVFS